MQNFRKLTVWSKAHALAVEIHRLTAAIPRRDNAELIDQMRRSSLSISTNIVEGSSRGSDRDFAKFLQIAAASASELEYLMLFATDLELISQATFSTRQGELVQIRKMLIALMQRANGTRPRRPLHSSSP